MNERISGVVHRTALDILPYSDRYGMPYCGTSLYNKNVLGYPTYPTHLGHPRVYLTYPGSNPGLSKLNTLCSN